jgi:hypothetical protein
MKRPLLLKHLVAHQILGIQTTSLNSLLQKMNDVNNALMRTAESFADTFNLPIQRHAVRLLLHHAQNGDFTILRHVMDELDEDKKAQPNPDAPMNSALVFRHTVSRIDDTTLKISLTDNAYATRNNDTVTQKNFDVAEGSPILIRIFPDGSLQYASATDDPDKRRWSQKPIGCVSSRIISLFRIVSDSDYFYHVHNRNEPMRQEVERILKDILSIQSLPDLLRYVRASSICSYSREELLLENSKVMMTPMLPQKNIPSIPMN